MQTCTHRWIDNRIVLSGLFAACLILSSCASGASLRSRTEPGSRCTLIPDHTVRASSLTIASTRLLSVNADFSSGTAEERLFSGQLYETLTWIDCTGETRPGLAVSWEPSDSLHQWTFFLRPSARFWNGASIRASDLISGWADIIKADPTIESVHSPGEGELRFNLTTPEKYFPRQMAEMRYSAIRPGPGPGINWNIGSGPFHIQNVRRAQSPGEFSKPDRVIHTISSENPNRPVTLIFRSADDADGRDFISAGVDVLITDDPLVSQFATAFSGYTDFPLPWEKTYVIAWQTKKSFDTESRNISAFSSEFADVLSSHVSPVDSRGGSIPEWYKEFSECRSNAGSTRHSGSIMGAHDDDMEQQVLTESDIQLRRIVYERNDPVAEVIAQRLSALSSTSPADHEAAKELKQQVTGWSDSEDIIPVSPVDAFELSELLRDGSDYFYVLPLRRRVPDPCSIDIRSHVSNRALILLDAASNLYFISLIDTRPHLLVTERVSGLSLDWFGNLRFLP